MKKEFLDAKMDGGVWDREGMYELVDAGFAVKVNGCREFSVRDCDIIPVRLCFKT
jgi:hypothetical protein